MLETEIETQSSRRPVDIETIVQNSAAFKISELMAGSGLPTLEGVPTDLAKEISAANDEADKIRKTAKSALSKTAEAIRSAVAGEDVANIGKLVDGCRVDKLNLLQSVVKFWTLAAELTQRQGAALKPVAIAADKEAETVVDAVKRDLEKIGSGVESMTASAHENPDLAAKQFDFIARHNVRARAAIIKAQDARSRVEATSEQFGRFTTRLAQSQKLLQSMAIDAIARA